MFVSFISMLAPNNQSMNNNKQTVEISYNENDVSVSSFISYLTPAFDRKGINHFYGVKLFLVIFSSGYASSVSCLENLVEFLELSRHDKYSYVVVPVFYGVSRLDVKQQSGLFSEAFTKLERSYSADQVTKWRNALAEIAELLGHEYNDELSEESEFLEEIARGVSEKLYPTEEIGIYKHQTGIENLLCKQPWGIRILGILGATGIGKTTLTRAVHRELSSDYDDSCFIEDFHSRYSEMKLEPLSSDFFDMVRIEEFDLNDSSSEPCYRQKRLLIILDDVRKAQDAKSFLGAIDKFSPGSLIIITSTDRQVLEQCLVNDIYVLKGLSEVDALKLFTRSAFGNRFIDQNLLDLSMRLVKCSDGNPSTLISYAEELKGKTTTQMESDLLKICLECDKTKNGVTKQIIQQCDAQIFLSDPLKLPVDPSPIPEPVVLSKDLRVCDLYHDLAMHSLFQRFDCQFPKIWERGGYYKSFSGLKKINLGHLESLVEAEELSEARCLEEIDLRDCKKLESIPVTDKLERLQSLNLSGCDKIKRFPRVVWTIKELNLEGTGIREIRSETTQFSQLVKQQSTTTLESNKENLNFQRF